MAVYAQRLRTTYLSARAQRQTLIIFENVSYLNASAGLAEWIDSDTRSQPQLTEYIAQLGCFLHNRGRISPLGTLRSTVHPCLSYQRCLSASAVVGIFFHFYIAVDLGLYFFFKSHQQANVQRKS